MSSVEADFTELVAQLDYTMFIVTAGNERERSGCLVGFASQVSIHPPRFLVCLSIKNHTYRVALASDTLAVHMVPDGEERLATLFGGETGDDIDKFARCECAAGPGGAPLILELENRFSGGVLERVDFGDHVGFVLAPIEVHHSDGEKPLTFHRAKWIDPGHEP